MRREILSSGWGLRLSSWGVERTKVWRRRELVLGNHWDAVLLRWSKWKAGRSASWRLLAKCLGWCFSLLGHLPGRKPGCGETDAGGGRHQNLFEQQGSEKDRKHPDVSGVYQPSVPSGPGTFGTHPAAGEVTPDLAADVALERHKWFLSKFVWSWTDPVWWPLPRAELKVKYYPGMPCVPTWLPVRLRRCAGWDCRQAVLLRHREDVHSLCWWLGTELVPRRGFL